MNERNACENINNIDNLYNSNASNIMLPFRPPKFELHQRTVFLVTVTAHHLL